MIFCLHADGMKIQVIAQLNYSTLSEEEFSRVHASIKRGDIVGINGFPGKFDQLLTYLYLFIGRCRLGYAMMVSFYGFAIPLSRETRHDVQRQFLDLRCFVCQERARREN
jgi:hypothetical protein